MAFARVMKDSVAVIVSTPFGAVVSPIAVLASLALSRPTGQAGSIGAYLGVNPKPPTGAPPPYPG